MRAPEGRGSVRAVREGRGASRSDSILPTSVRDLSGTFRAHNDAIYSEPMRNSEISAAGQITCATCSPWLERHPHRTRPIDRLASRVSHYRTCPVPSLFRQSRKTTEDAHQRPQLPTQVMHVIGNIGTAQLHPRLITPRSMRDACQPRARTERNHRHRAVARR